jgi:hypothetical protein
MNFMIPLAMQRLMAMMDFMFASCRRDPFVDIQPASNFSLAVWETRLGRSFKVQTKVLKADKDCGKECRQ